MAERAQCPGRWPSRLCRRCKEAHCLADLSCGRSPPVFLTHSGKQVDTRSAHLFNFLFLALLLALRAAGVGFRCSAASAKPYPGLADDLTLICHSAEGMSRLLQVVVRAGFFTWSGMRIKLTKSVITVYDFRTWRELPTDEMRHHGQALTHLLADESFRYLGARLMPTEGLRLLLLLPGFGRRKEVHRRSGKRVQGGSQTAWQQWIMGSWRHGSCSVWARPCQIQFRYFKTEPRNWARISIDWLHWKNLLGLLSQNLTGTQFENSGLHSVPSALFHGEADVTAAAVANQRYQSWFNIASIIILRINCNWYFLFNNALDLHNNEPLKFGNNLSANVLKQPKFMSVI